jgi:SAM-dependent methyltransferase
MEPYHPEPYWSRVAQEIKLRTRHGQVAGDDAPYYRYKREKFLSRFLGSLDVEGRITLEVGCGPGGNLLHLARRGPKQLIGVDISPVMLEVAAETVRDSRQPVELRQINGTRLPFPDGSIDLTLTVTVLQHNTDPSMFARLVGDICRVTRDMVVLVEDVGTETSTIDPGCSWILRPVTAYEAECRRHGFRLVGAASLNTAPPSAAVFTTRSRDVCSGTAIGKASPCLQQHAW